MKKILTLCTVLLLAFAMSITFTACDNGSGNGPSGVPGGDLVDGPGDTPGDDPDGSEDPVLIKAGLYAKLPDAITADDEPIDISEMTGTTIVEKAVAYFKTSSTIATFTLVLDADTSAAPQEFDIYSFALIGIGGRPNITLTSEGSLFTVNSTASLTLENIRLKGINTNNAPLVKIKGGKLIMKNGSAITSNTNILADDHVFLDDWEEHLGGGVFMNGGTFIMEDGEISFNGNEIESADLTPGAGVLIMDGTFEMKGGAIKYNHAHFMGGGVYLGDGGDAVETSRPKFIMSGGEITENWAVCIFRSERSSSPVNEIQRYGKKDPHLRDEIHPGERCLI